jgi:tetratricopeptide (TPR) repeat protein
MKLYEQSLAMTRRLGDERLAGQTLYNMADLLRKRKEFAQALPLAREAKEIAHRIGVPDAAVYDKLVADLEKKAGKQGLFR